MKRKMYQGKQILMDDKDYRFVCEILSDADKPKRHTEHGLKVEYNGHVMFLMAAVHEHGIDETVKPKNGNPYDIRFSNTMFLDMPKMVREKRVRFV